jgi:hypothetical protein
MNAKPIIIALLLGLVTFLICNLFLPAPLPLLFAILVVAIVIINRSPTIA